MYTIYVKDGRKYDRKVLEYIRISTIKRIREGVSIREIVKQLGFSRQVVYKWFWIYKKQGLKGLEKKKSTGRPHKLGDNVGRILWRILTYKPIKYGFDTDLWTCNRVGEVINKDYNIKLHPTTVMRLLKKNGFSVQKPRVTAYQQDSKEIQRWLNETWPEIRVWAKKKQAIIYFEDESGIRVNHVSGRTWSLRGNTPIVVRNGARDSINLISAISPAGKLLFSVKKERIDSKIFIGFIANILHHHKYRKIALVIDRAPYHISNKVKVFFEENKKRLRVWYLPKYSPELNPDEKVWCHLKENGIGKKCIKNKEDLAKVVSKHLRRLQRNPQLVASFFCALL